MQTQNSESGIWMTRPKQAGEDSGMKNINSGRKRDLETLFKALTTIISCSERTRNGI